MPTRSSSSVFVNKEEDGYSVSTRLREKFERELKEPVQVDIRQVDSIPDDGLKYRAFVRKFQVLIQADLLFFRLDSPNCNKMPGEIAGRQFCQGFKLAQQGEKSFLGRG